MTWQERYEQFRDAFAEAIDPRFYSIEYLDWMLAEGHAAIWFSDNAAIVAEIKTFPTGARAVCGVVAAGDKDQIVDLIPLAEQWGRQNGCMFGMIESRAAWGKIMKQHGYAPFQFSFVKEL